MTTPHDPDVDTQKPARSVETFDDRSTPARNPATSGIALFVLMAVLALIALFLVLSWIQ